MSIHIRPAVPEDAPALQALNAAFNGDTGVTEEAIRRCLVTGSEIVLIAEDRGEPVGFCCAQVHHSFCYPAPVAEVTEILLREEYGADEMHLLTGMTNHAAQAAYRKAGFRPHDEQYMSHKLR